MIVRLFMLGACASAVIACAKTETAGPDASNDVHCVVMAVYFNGLAAHQGAPADQQRSSRIVGEWYRLKVRAASPQLQADDKDLQREIAPWFETMKQDPAFAADEFAACTRRAVADPGFESFARALPN